MIAVVWEPDGLQGPGRLSEVALPVGSAEGSTLVVGRVTVTDTRGGRLFEDDRDLCFDPAFGGGPLQSAAAEHEARRFGVVNTAYHLWRALSWAESLLDRSLPQVKACIGPHRHERPRWAGGHYRLPASAYAELPEADQPSPDGEIHLGTGGGYLRWRGERYFDAPSHNSAIVVHEFGHHLTRHTADFRLNRWRSPLEQANRKIPLDEGTADYVTGVLLGTADIYGWHRQNVPSEHPARRKLLSDRTMAMFSADWHTDPHVDGTVWASALWAARHAVTSLGYEGSEFDAAVLSALDQAGRTRPALPKVEALRQRRELGPVVGYLLETLRTLDPGLASAAADSFARSGIHPHMSNAEMRDLERSKGQPVWSATLERAGTR